MRRALRPAWLSLALPALFAGSLLLTPPHLSGQSRDERAVRAAYVFNLIKYVEWPPEKGELIIAFVGNPAIGDMMQKMLNGRANESLKVTVLQDPSDEDLKRCSIAYIADSQTIQARNALGKLKSRNILTIGDTDSFARDGGMVGLVKVGDRIQIQVNLEAAQRSGIKISSRVLSLALIVRTAQTAKN